MILTVLAVSAFVSEFTFVRHGETVANATGKYNSRTLNELSELGKKQVEELTAKLKATPRFDAIYVSPSLRAMKTIYPYLKATNQKATIWPLLYECCTGRRGDAKATKFSWGEKISVPETFLPYFVIKQGWERLPVSPDYSAGLAQVQASVKEFSTIARGSVLLVGHSGQGGQFLYALTAKRMQVKNATPIRILLR